MRFFFHLFLTAAFLNQANAQTFTPDWAQNLGNHGLGGVTITAMQTTSNGDLYAAGTSNGTVDLDPSAGFDLQTLTSGSGNTLAFMIHYDSTGAYIEHKTFGGLGHVTNISDMAIDADGNFIFVGEFRDSTYFEPTSIVYSPPITYVGYIAKYDPSFNLVWVKLFTPGTSVTMDKVALDADGNIGVAGQFNGTMDFDPGVGVTSLTSVLTDVFFGKYSTDGDLLWIKKATSSLTDKVGDVVFDADGNFFFGGNYPADVTIDGTAYFSGPYDNFVCVTKFSPDGTYLWNKGIANSGSNDQMYINSMTVGPTGNIFFTGKYRGQANYEGSNHFSSSSAGSLNFYIIAIDGMTGAGLWGNGIYSTASEGQSLTVDASGNLFVSGTFNSSIDLDFSVGIATVTSSPASTNNYFVASYNASGAYRWAKQIGTSGTSVVSHDVDGRVWACGTFYGTVDFDPSAGVNNITVPTTTTFFNRYSATSAYLESFALKGSGTTREAVNAIKITTNDKVVMAGTFKGDVDFDNGPGAFVLSSPSDTTSFVAQYDLDGNLEWAFSLTGLAYTSALDVDAAGNIYLTGFFTGSVDFDPTTATASYNTNTNAIFMAKYSPTGSLLFANAVNGSGDDRANDIKLDLQGNFIITGNFGGAVDFDPSVGVFTLTNPQNLNYGFAAKYSSTGAFINAWRFTGVTGRGLGIDANNGVLVAGHFRGVANFNLAASGGLLYAVGGSSDNDYFVASYDAGGNYQWAFRLGSGSTSVRSIDLVCEGQNAFYVAGYFGSFQDSVDVDPSATALYLPADKSILARYGSDGSLQWAINMGATGSSGTHDFIQLAEDNNQNVTYAARFSGTADIDPSNSSTAIVTNGVPGLLIARLSPSGLYLNEQHYDRTNVIRPLALSIVGDRVVVAGDYAGNTWFDLPPGSGPFMMPAIGTTTTIGNGFALMGTQSSYYESPVSVTDALVSELSAYPNPFSSSVTVSLPSNFAISDSGLPIEVMDAIGRVVHRQTITQTSTSSITLSLSHLPGGSYILSLKGADVRLNVLAVRE